MQRTHLCAKLGSGLGASRRAPVSRLPAGAQASVWVWGRLPLVGGAARVASSERHQRSTPGSCASWTKGSCGAAGPLDGGGRQGLQAARTGQPARCSLLHVLCEGRHGCRQRAAAPAQGFLARHRQKGSRRSSSVLMGA